MAAPGKEEKALRDALPPAEPPALRRALGLPLVGDYVTLGVAAVPLLVLLAARAVAGVTGEIGGWFGVLASVLTGAWLVFLQKRYGVKLTVPVFRIPLLWLMPVYLLASIIELMS